jgi:hypothetical protein
MRRSLSLPLFLLLTITVSACVKRIPAQAGGDRKVVAGLPIELGQPSEVPEGAAVVWKLGDGTEVQGPQVTHAWHRPGTYQVSVAVTDPDGKLRSDEAQVQVSRPPLLTILPETAGYVLVSDRPGERIKAVPLFLERLLAAGQDANAILATLREAGGFDLFSAQGWADAGLDPEGELALVGLDGGRETMVVVALGPGEGARKILRSLLLKRGDAKEQPAEKDPAVTEVRTVDKGDLLAAYADYRGHLWVGFAEHGSDPVRTLSDLRASKPGAGIDQEPTFKRAMGLRKADGAARLYMTRSFFELSEKQEMASAGEAERRRHAQILQRLGFLRADLDLRADALVVELRLGLDGEEAKGLSAVAKARNPLPPFRGMLAANRHLMAKLSADWVGVVRTLMEAVGEVEKWKELNFAMEAFAAKSGLQLKPWLLDNLGDSFMLSLSFKGSGLLALSGDSATRPALQELIEGVAYLQVRDAQAFGQALDGLCGQENGLAWLRPDHQKGNKRWRLGKDAQGLFVELADGLVLIASSEELLAQARQRIAKPGSKATVWPASLEAGDTQVLALDLGQLRSDLEKAEPPSGNVSAAMLKGMLTMGLQKVGDLHTLVLEASMDATTLTLRAQLSLQ